jgi:hypothetical protein
MIGMRRLPGRPLILAAVAAGALVAGAGVAMAATSGSSASVASSRQVAATPVPSGVARPRWPGFRRPGWPEFRRPGDRFGFAFGGPFGAVHGQFVVARPGGGYQTIDTQRGSVTAVSATSITIRSSDGFTKTYQVTSSTNVDALRDGIASVKTGQQAAVVAPVDGSTATAASIVDFALLPRIGVAPGAPGMNHSAPAGWVG